MTSPEVLGHWVKLIWGGKMNSSMVAEFALSLWWMLYENLLVGGGGVENVKK